MGGWFILSIGGKNMAEENKTGEKHVRTAEEKMNLIWLVWNLVEGGLLLVAGILAIVFGVIAEGGDGQAISTEATVIQRIILYVLATFIILDGALRTLLLVKNYKKSDSSAFLVGGFEIAVGIVLMIMGYEYFFQLIINFLAVFLIVIGALFLGVSVYVIVRKLDKMTMPILEIVFGAIVIGFGIALLVLFHAGNAEAKNRITFVLIGSIMAIAGGVMVVITLIRDRKRKKALKEKKGPEDDSATVVDCTGETQSPKEEVKEEAKAPKEEPAPKKEPQVIEVELTDVPQIENKSDKPAE